MHPPRLGVAVQDHNLVALSARRYLLLWETWHRGRVVEYWVGSRLSCRFAGVPVVIVTHGCSAARIQGESNGRRQIVRLVFAGSQTVVVTKLCACQFNAVVGATCKRHQLILTAQQAISLGEFHGPPTGLWPAFFFLGGRVIFFPLSLMRSDLGRIPLPTLTSAFTVVVRRYRCARFGLQDPEPLGALLLGCGVIGGGGGHRSRSEEYCESDLV